jgi:hypothetical protein
MSPPSSGSNINPSKNPGLFSTCFVLVSCLAYSSTLKILVDTTYTSETSVDFQWTAWRYVPEDRNLLNLVFANISDISVEIAKLDAVVPDSYHTPPVIDLSIFLACTSQLRAVYFATKPAEIMLYKRISSNEWCPVLSTPLWTLLNQAVPYASSRKSKFPC